MKGFVDFPTLLFIIFAIIFLIMFMPGVDTLSQQVANSMPSNLTSAWFRIITPLEYLLVLVALLAVVFGATRL